MPYYWSPLVIMVNTLQRSYPGGLGVSMWSTLAVPGPRLPSLEWFLSTDHTRQSNLFIGYLGYSTFIGCFISSGRSTKSGRNVPVDDIWCSGRDCWCNGTLVTRHFNKNRGTSGGMGRGLDHLIVAKSLGSTFMLHAGWQWKQTKLKIIFSLELRKFIYKRKTCCSQTFLITEAIPKALKARAFRGACSPSKFRNLDTRKCHF